MRRAVWGIVAVVVLAAGCSHARGHPATTAATAADPLPSVAASLGCTYERYGPPEELHTLEAGSCGDLTLYWFASPAERDRWLLTVPAGSVIVVKRGPTWLAVRE